MSLLIRAGFFLKGYSMDGLNECNPRSAFVRDFSQAGNKTYKNNNLLARLERAYLSKTGLSIIAVIGALMAVVGGMALAIAAGHLPGVANWLNISHLPASTLVTFGASMVAVGGAITLAHLSMLGLKKLASCVDNE